MDLTKEEQEHVRAAITYLRARMGTWEALARALHFDAATFIHVVARRKAASPTMAFRVARIAGIGIDDLLAGKFLPSGTCPHCGTAAATLARHDDLREMPVRHPTHT
jgi:hypothetical protein